jgi:hypothetical protein
VVRIFSAKYPGVYRTGDGAGVDGGAGLGAVSGVPHSPQNLARGSTSAPHWGQRTLKGVPHSMQNLVPLGVSASQRGQCMGTPSGTAVERLGCARTHVSMRTIDRGIWDEVSVLQAVPGVK